MSSGVQFVLQAFLTQPQLREPVVEQAQVGRVDVRGHPLVRLKFRSADRLPFYNLHRERAAHIATPVAAARPRRLVLLLEQRGPLSL